MTVFTSFSHFVSILVVSFTRSLFSHSIWDTYYVFLYFVHLSCVSHALCVCRIYIIHIHICIYIYIIYIYIRILYIHLFVHYIYTYIYIYILLQWIYSCKTPKTFIYSHICETPLNHPLRIPNNQPKTKKKKKKKNEKKQRKNVPGHTKTKNPYRRSRIASNSDRRTQHVLPESLPN